MTYGFTVYLKSVTAVTDDLANRLFESGCDDGTPFSRDGEVAIGFDRDAPSLEAAIASAVADVRSAGFAVSRIELDPADLPAIA
jgi:hypothetical protein